MSALWYIVRKSLKNTFKDALRKPGKLVIWLFVIVLIVGVALISILTEQDEQSSPIYWFTGVLFLFITLFMVATLLRGLSGGDAIFEMSDVNLLFVSPVNSRRILLYGMVRMAKTAFWSGFFILFQAQTLRTFGIEYEGVLITFALYIVSMLVMLIASLLIYSVTNSRPSRKRAVKIIIAALFAPLAVYLVALYFSTQDIFAALEAAIRSPFLQWIPIAGWTAAGTTAFLAGETVTGVIFLALNVSVGAGMAAYMLRANPDYYEDVLVATETAFEKKRAVEDGNINAGTQNAKPVKIRGTGIFGQGASALFGKHMRENFRESRLGVLTLSSIFIIAAGAIASAALGDIFIVLQILIWVQIMLIGTGRGLKETYTHYIYMIPESSFKKIVWSNMEIMARTVIESALLFGIGGAVSGAGLVYIVVCALVYILFSFLLLGVNYLSMRFVGTDISAGVMILIYYLSVIIAMAPGLVAAIVVGFSIGGDAGMLLGMLIMCGWELAAGLGCFALSTGVLHNTDIQSMPVKK